jgi:sulfur-oxidizing protein SoxZ
MSNAIVQVPATARGGEVVEIKALVAHRMETGFRRTQLGEQIPRDIIRSFSCHYNGEEVFRADLHPAVSANPLLVFHVVAVVSGALTFRWTGDNGFSVTESATITVS